ncbi:MAG: sigma 54-interacting transcriptional regulator [Lachnospiraceae bacterium]|nr:sigma 54-interacting transcriptional regulator [Lachnospiraceae bacterium]
MVKIRVFIPHLDLKEIFDDVVKKLPRYDNVQIETTYVFGTPTMLSQNWDAEILVARGMTHDVLKDLFPHKHVIEIQLNSFDVFEALLQCREMQAKKVALLLHDMEIPGIPKLEEFCGCTITLYDAPDEKSAESVICRAMEEGADVFVGAGTMCGICDRMGLRRVHIHTKHDAAEAAMQEALNTAKTINLERTRSEIINTMLNHSEDVILALDGRGNVQAINNQAYREFQLSAAQELIGSPVSALVPIKEWEQLLQGNSEKEQILQLNGKNYYIQYKPLNDEELENGALIFIKNTDRIMEEESKIRRELAEKGLTAKYSFKHILGHSSAIRENIQMAERYSKVNSNVLIIGETGTGKELFAHSIHQASRRSNQPFVALNCAALPENLLESELFGYEAGAFSGAAKGGKIGLFELAHKGTIFLDEIGEIPISLQAKLLRVLQEKEIRRIGSTSVHPIDVRVISATNINIEKKIEEGKFRSDLYYRLNLLDISIPPLRERKEDIQELVDFYLARFACEMEKSIPVITPEAAVILKEHSWPGNVRELRNICERLTVLNDTNVIDEEILRQLKVFQKKEEPPVHQPVLDSDPDSVYSRLQPRKKKKDLAEELGVSRTTLWRMAKRQSELERKQREQSEQKH